MTIGFHLRMRQLASQYLIVLKLSRQLLTAPAANGPVCEVGLSLILTWTHVQELKLGRCSLAGIQATADLTGLTCLQLGHSLAPNEMGSNGPLAMLIGRLSHLQDLCLTWHWSRDFLPAGHAISILPPDVTLPSKLTRLLLGMLTF